MPENEMADNLFLFGPAAAPAPVKQGADAQTQLIERAAAGDSEAFAELYRIFAPMVHGIVLARVPYDEVRDQVQEVFLTAYRNLRSLRDTNAAGAWLATIARNHAIEYFRRAKPTEELPEELSGRSSSQIEAVEILTALRSLPEAYRETMILRLVQGMTGNEIAERTGMKPESVRVNLHRGMEILRRQLGITEGRK